MAQMIDVDVFDNDERIIVNKACEGTPIADFTRAGFLANLNFSRSISTEQDVLNLLDGLIAKTERISDISIHAPTRGATVKSVHTKGKKRFQSTLPREERL